MNYSSLTQIDKLDTIAALTGWIGGALEDAEQAETPPLEWWEEVGLSFSENASRLVGSATEMYTIPEMIEIVKRLAELL